MLDRVCEPGSQLGRRAGREKSPPTILEREPLLQVLRAVATEGEALGLGADLLNHLRPACWPGHKSWPRSADDYGQTLQTPKAWREQLALRKQAVDDVLAHPEWSLAQAARHLKKTMRLTTAEMAKLLGVAYRTLQDIEKERSDGNVQTMNRLFGMLGLRLGVVRVDEEASAAGPDR